MKFKNRFVEWLVMTCICYPYAFDKYSHDSYMPTKDRIVLERWLWLTLVKRHMWTVKEIKR